MNGRRRRAGWTLTCAVLTVFLESFFRQPVVWPLAIGIAALTGAAAWRPHPTLLVVAALSPLATMLFNLGRGTAASVQFGETIVLAFLTGWAARRAFSGMPLRVPPLIRGTALLLILAAVASAIVHWCGLRAEVQMEPLGDMLQGYVFRDYPLRPPGGEPITAPVVFASGLLLLLATADLCAAAPAYRLAVLRMMVCGAAAAATLNLLRIIVAAAQQEHVLAALGTYFASMRVNVHYADLNAAGSCFALALMIAIGLAVRHRWLSLITTPVIAAGLWVTGSRFALASVVAVISMLALATWRRAPSRLARAAVALTLAVILAGAAVLSIRYPEGRNEKAWSAFTFRIDLARAGLQMAAERPLSGVGLGRFYRLSGDYAPQALARLGFARENAHNQFIQILAELGVPGLLGFLVLVGAALHQALRGETPRPFHVTGLVAGIGAFLLSALGGHPLVVPDATYVFWLAIGLAATPMLDVPPSTGWWRLTVLFLALAIAASVPWRAARATAEADLEKVSSGLSMWQRETDGTRYRWAGSRATFFVPSSARAVAIPLRYGSESVGPIEVRIFLDGREADRMQVSPEDGWRAVRLVLLRSTRAKFSRIDLVAAPPGGAGSPAMQPTSDRGLFRVGRPADE